MNTPSDPEELAAMASRIYVRSRSYGISERDFQYLVAEYMKSPEWKAKTSIMLERSGGLFRGFLAPMRSVSARGGG